MATESDTFMICTALPLFYVTVRANITLNPCHYLEGDLGDTCVAVTEHWPSVHRALLSLLQNMAVGGMSKYSIFL